jgi:hypothetical protein
LDGFPTFGVPALQAIFGKNTDFFDFYDFTQFSKNKKTTSHTKAKSNENPPVTSQFRPNSPLGHFGRLSALWWSRP